MKEVFKPMFSPMEIWHNLFIMYCGKCKHTYHISEECKDCISFDFVESIDDALHYRNAEPLQDGKCPNCGGTVGRSGDYCKWCGQKIRRQDND